MGHEIKRTLCARCYKKKGDVIDGKVNCEAAGKMVDSVPYKNRLRFEDCQHRITDLGRPVLEPTLLMELSRRVIQHKEKFNGEIDSDAIAKIEAKLVAELA